MEVDRAHRQPEIVIRVWQNLALIHQRVPFPEASTLKQYHLQILHHRFYYFRFRMQLEVLKKCAPTEKLLVRHV